MLDSFLLRLSRRGALKVGAGVVALVAAAGPIEAARTLAAFPEGSTRDPIDGVGEVEGVDGGSVVARVFGGQTVSAALVGFPAGFTPRVGDLVAVDTRTVRVLCAPTSQPGATVAQTGSVNSSPTAHPLCRWLVGTVGMKSGVPSICNVSLVPSALVLEAAERRAPVTICTEDTTLPDRQVLAIRTP